MAESQIHIALASNPNCGKTTLFSLIAGQNGCNTGKLAGRYGQKKQAPLSADKALSSRTSRASIRCLRMARKSRCRATTS